jgi:hypothetical protein
MLHHESMIGNQPPQPPGMSAARDGFGQQRSYRKSSNAPSQNFEPGAFKVDEAVKSHKPDGFEKSSISRRANFEE